MLAIALATLLLAAAARGAGATDLQAGKALVERTCYACHGLNGMSRMSLYPNLAGQKRRYLAAELHDFRDGARKNPIMSLIAAHLTNAQIRDVAAYFASLEPGSGALRGTPGTGACAHARIAPPDGPRRATRDGGPDRS